MAISYWERRALRVKATSLKNSERYEQQVNSRMKAVEDEISEAIRKFTIRYANDSGLTLEEAQANLTTSEVHKWKSSLQEWESMATSPEYKKRYKQLMDIEYAKSQITRLEALKAQTQLIMAKHAGKEREYFEKQLIGNFEDTYYRTTYNVQNQRVAFNANFQQFNYETMKAIVSQGWQGSDFSKRLWNNMVNTIPSYLENALYRGAALGYGVDRMVQQAQTVFRHQTKANLHRLINTEMAHVTEQATAATYKESNVEKYEYLATLERHTCEVCRELDGEVYKLKDKEPGINYPLIHPNCRCTTVPWIPEVEEANLARWSKDPHTGERQYVRKSYDEWRQEAERVFETKKSEGEYGANLKYVTSEAFANKVRANETLAPIADTVISLSKQMLRHRNGTPMEDMAVIEFKTGKVLATYDKSRTPHGIDRYTSRMKSEFNNSERNGLVVIHNHPNNVPPSPDDVRALQKKHNGKTRYGIVIGHDGTIYVYTKPKYQLPDARNLLAKWVSGYKHERTGSETERQMASLERLGHEYGFRIFKI